MSSTESALRLDDVCVAFPRRPEPILRNVTLVLERGEQLVVFGASGSGKSTLLQAITGVVPHTVSAALTGTVTVNGRATTQCSVVELSRHVGTLAQDPSSGICLPDVEQELALPLENHAVPADEISERIDRALASVRALTLRGRRTDQLSGGEGQRVALAAALINGPDLLLLDEPTSMLDPAGVAAVRQAINTAVAAHGPAVVLVEHRLDDYAGPDGVAGLPARAIVLGEDGHVVAAGATSDVLTEHAGRLHAAGCWLPLETELQAVTGFSGGLAEPAVRQGLRSHAPPAPAGDRAAEPVGPVVLAVDDLAVSRAAWVPRRRWARRRRVREAPEVPKLLERVSFRLRTGEVTALLGPNGAGKTSLLLTLAGLLPQAGGSVSGPRPGLVFQNPEHQFVAHTVRDEVGHGLTDAPPGRVDDLLDQHRLAHLAEQSPHRLSGGEKRRLSMAAMLAHERPVLLADEPTFGLDRRDTLATLAALRSAAVSRSVLFSSHDLRSVAATADRALVIADRSVIADGPVLEVLRDPVVLERAGLRLPPLLQWLLLEFDSADQVRAVLSWLDAAPAVVPATAAET
ncbi:ABC transporter ATP-binding protein [Ornithinimicrobium murale]|uniref:ABC transporter ATP-binding protein n=1 Tax=Ornithinimicrobium murale TaxID=1050153 RepID=UPI0013B3709C|nr:ABC transporter ATP-binding protein [Ornithinimicrobium murale]